MQLAKYFGAEVTGVCGTANMELVKSLGADRVVDYTREDFAESRETYDVILDAVAKTSFSRCRGSLRQRGVYLTVGMGPMILLQMLWTSTTSSQKVIFGMAPNRIQDLIFLKELIQAGRMRSVIDRTYPLEQTVEAHRYVETGHKKGNVVITVVEGN